MKSAWSKAEMAKLEKAYKSKPAWMTDYTLAGQLASVLKRSPESIRWQLRQLHRTTHVGSPRILLLDIETLPLEGKFWSPWNQNMNPAQIKKDWSIVCWSAKWLFDKKVVGEAVSGEEAIERKDASVLGTIWEMMNEAHVVITHNGDDFDLKKLNTRFLIAGMPKPMYYKSIDTLSVLKKNFSFTYNKMDEVNKTLGIGRKVETSFKWWDECSDGNETYIKKMLDYNKQDVNVLEELYLRLRPWITGHPNMNIFSVNKDVESCPTCTSLNIDWSGTYSTQLGLYKAFRCEDCGAIGRSTQKQYKITGVKWTS